jgi:hypothetical protein
MMWSWQHPWCRCGSGRRCRCMCRCGCRYWSALCAISAAGIGNPATSTSAPDDHCTSCVASSPHCGVRASSGWGAVGVRCSPGIRTRNVLAASVNVLEESATTPDDHLSSGPNCRVTGSTIRRANGAGRGPTVSGRVVSPACVWKAKKFFLSAPDDHCTRGPHGCV